MTNAPHPDAARTADRGAARDEPKTGSGGGLSRILRGTPERTGTRSRLGRLFAVVAIIEAVTWTGLLVGMFLKYVTETTELGVYVFGRLHGAAFVLYVIVTLVAAIRLRWGWKPAFLAFVAAIPPLATLPLEIGLRRRGYLDQPREDAPNAAPRDPAR